MGLFRALWRQGSEKRCNSPSKFFVVAEPSLSLCPIQRLFLSLGTLSSQLQVLLRNEQWIEVFFQKSLLFHATSPEVTNIILWWIGQEQPRYSSFSISTAPQHKLDIFSPISPPDVISFRPNISLAASKTSDHRGRLFPTSLTTTTCMNLSLN